MQPIPAPSATSCARNIGRPARRNRVATGMAAFALAAAFSPTRAEGRFDRAAVDVHRLAAVRGGFSAPDGSLAVSFGLQRGVLVDGVPVAQAAGGATLLVLQRGANNALRIAPDASSVGTVIQNSLDNQKLQAVTTLDVTTNSLQVFRGAALAAQLRTSLTDSLRR